MLYRYAAFVWDPLESSSRDEATMITLAFRRSMPDWTCVLDSKGLTVFHAPYPRRDLTTYVLPRGCGVVLGRLFYSDLKDTTVVIDERSGLRYAENGGQTFIDDYWGGYVAFFNDLSNNSRHIIRDCSGKLPCFRMRARTVEIVFSHINDIKGLPLSLPTINWDYISAFLFYEQLQTRSSGLTGVTEILGGEVVEFRGSRVEQRVLWDPGRVARLTNFNTESQALEELRFTVQQCVTRWASIYKSIIHSLSGGVDSAVVLACLARARRRPDILCLNR